MKSKYQSLLSDIEEFYNSIGPRYKLIYPNIATSNSLIASSLKKQKLIKENSKIADVACSGGWLLNEISLICSKCILIGYDISRVSIDYAKKNFSKKNDRLNFEVADWLHLKIATTKKFDLVLCTGNSLTHFPPWLQKKILISFSSILDKEGVLIVDSYKGWNEKLKSRFEIEPKGLTKLPDRDIVSYFLSIYSKEIAQRNICFATYSRNQGQITKPDFKTYVTYQYSFILPLSNKTETYGFSRIEPIEIEDGIGIFEYYKLTK